MPSQLIQNTSGGDLVYSGYIGQGYPHRGVELALSPGSLGNAYFGLSGGITVNSGTATPSVTDGEVIQPGGVRFVPFPDDKQNVRLFNIYMSCDAACSGQARVYYNAY